MKKTSITDEQLKKDFDVVNGHTAPIPARLMYDLTCALLTAARAEDDPITGRSYQWFIANMVECLYGVKKPAESDRRLLTDEGLNRLYTQDINPRDLSVYILAVMTAINTAIPNLETAEERRFAEGLYTAKCSMLHGLAEYIQDVKPAQKSDA